MMAAMFVALLYVRKRNKHIEWLVAEIEATNGTISLPPSIWERGRRFVQGEGGSLEGTSVGLNDIALRNSWMRDHGNLAELQIAEIYLRATREFDAEDAGLFADNPVAAVAAPLARNVDGVAAAMTNSATLTSLDARGSDLTDEGLSLLPLEQLQSLFLQNSTVTAKGLHELQRCEQLEYLAIDGSQLNSELIEALNPLPKALRLVLVGRKVTDEHLRLVSGLNLERLDLERTSVTSEGIEQYHSSQPDVEFAETGRR